MPSLARTHFTSIPSSSSHAASGKGSGLAVVPLHHTGSLDAFESHRLTPAIGIKFKKQLQLKQVLNAPQEQKRAILRDIAITVSQNGVAFFSAQDDLLPVDLATIGLALGELSGGTGGLHIHPTQELGENGLPIGTISSVPGKDGRQINFLGERSKLASSNWHSDVSFEPRSASYTILRMHSLPSLGGDTLFSSAYALYDLLSPTMAAFLSTLSALHDAQIFRDQARKYGFQLRTLPRGCDENVGDSFQAIHPIIRTNPVTGRRGLFVNKEFTNRIVELNVDESDAMLAYLFRLQHESHNTHVRYRWSKNDVAIWDNRSTAHAATFDHNEFRSGDRVVVVGERPYLDADQVGKHS